MWFRLIKQYWQVSLFKETPANTPYSPFLLGVTVLFFFLLVVVQWLIADVGALYALTSALLSAGTLVASYALYTLLLLALFGMANRTVQTLTCLLACHAIVHVFALPLLLMTPLLLGSTLAEPLALFISIVYLFLTLGLTVWQFMVTVYIYKHALEKDYLPAILAGLGLLACSILIVSLWR